MVHSSRITLVVGEVKGPFVGPTELALHCVCKPQCYQEVEGMTRPVTIISILLNATLLPQSSYSVIYRAAAASTTSTTTSPYAVGISNGWISTPMVA